MKARFANNGSLTIESPGPRFVNSYPGLEDGAIHPLGFEVADNARSALFRFDSGTLELHLSSSSSGRIDLDTRFSGAVTPHWLFPLHGAAVHGATRFFRTGFGFSGPTNIVPLVPENELFSYESYLISAVVGDDGSALIVYTTDNRRFTQKTQIYNRIYRDEFRNRHVVEAPVFLETGFSTENIPIRDEGLVLPTIHLLACSNLADGLDQAARHIARQNHARVPGHTPVYYCSWYEKLDQFSADDLDRVIKGAAKTEAHFDTIQIDDGYNTGWGDWLIPNPQWPGGMAAAAKAIQSTGQRAGIWVAPMTAERGSRIWRDHPDWLLHDLDGQPIVKMKAGEHEASSHGDRFALDLSHPDVRDFIRHVFATFRSWGFTLFKTDFMDWGYVDSTTVRRHTPGKTSVMWFDEALRIIRDSIGPDSYWLACIAPFAPLVGYCDGMRIGSDVGTHWNKPGGKGNDGVGGGIMNMLQESYHDQFFNGIFWANDPDVIFLRTQNTGLSETEVRSLALWSGILGGTITISDFFDDLPPERIALWRFIHPRGAAHHVARLPFWTEPVQKLYVAVRDYPAHDGHAVLILNPFDTAQSGIFALQDLTGMESTPVTLWRQDASTPAGLLREISVTLPAYGCELYWVGGSTPPLKL